MWSACVARRPPPEAEHRLPHALVESTKPAPPVISTRQSGIEAWFRQHAPEVAFVCLLLLGAAIVLYETRGLSFYFDDWDFVLHRRGLTASSLLQAHGPHLSLVPILIYKLLLKLFGGGSYLPFRMLAAVDLVLIAFVLGLVSRRWWGRRWGLAPVLLMVTLGAGGWTLLWSFQVGYALATAAGIGALLALDSDPIRGGGPLACGCLIISLASGSQGIGFLAGAAVLLIIRRRPRDGVWVALPAILY